MMLKRESYIKQISDILAMLQSAIHLRGHASLYDINIVSEDFFKDLLNLIYDYQLMNLNVERRSAVGVDLGDDTSRVCIQVTSTTKRYKIQETIDKFIEYGWHFRYDDLFIFILGSKQKRYNPFDTRDLFDFDPLSHILDFGDLTRRIRTLDLPKLKLLAHLLESNLVLPDDSLLRVKLDETDYESYSLDTKTSRSSESVFQEYLNKMENLLLNHNLLQSHRDDEVRSIARTRTLDVLRMLNGKYKGYIIQFLHEAELLNTNWVGDDFSFSKGPIVQLRSADLRGAVLKGAGLSKVHLEQVDLSDADLRRAYLNGACFLGSTMLEVNLSKANMQLASVQVTRLIASNLRDVDLLRADLSMANLARTNLGNANLFGAQFCFSSLEKANLTGAKLCKANFRGSNLIDATVDPDQLTIVDKVPYIMPDGSKNENAS